MSSVKPDRDAGSDTFARFRYQAEVTLPYCVSALLLENDIEAVIVEHYEDIALKTKTGWRFLQVKSRNPERGLWSAADLLAEKGGALRSLYRTYLLTKDEDCTLELVLEGAVKTDDAIGTLRTNQDRSQLAQKVMDKLGASQTSAADFLSRVVLNENVTHRAEIHATNARLLHQHAPSLTLPELKVLHCELLEEIEKAMRCEPLGTRWPQNIVHPKKRSSEMEERLRAKTLDVNRLSTIAEPLIKAGRPLLKRLVEPGGGPVSTLMQKLLQGGATPKLIEEARNLHANAYHQRLVRAAKEVAPDNELVMDLHERILTYATTAAALHASSSQPAIEIWNYLLNKFDTNAADIDRHNLTHADPMMLMGESCILSNECVFDWGEAQNGLE